MIYETPILLSIQSGNTIGERNAQDVIDNELKAFPLSLGSFAISLEDSSAVASVLGLSKAKAVYTKGWGCTLLRDMGELEFRQHRNPMYINRPTLSDSLEWPLGSLVKTSSDSLDIFFFPVY